MVDDMFCFTLLVFHIAIGIGIALSIRMTFYVMKVPTLGRVTTFLFILGVCSILSCYFLYFTIPFFAGMIVLLTFYPHAGSGRGIYGTTRGNSKSVFSGPPHTIDLEEDIGDKEPFIGWKNLMLITGFLLFSISGAWFFLFY